MNKITGFLLSTITLFLSACATQQVSVEARFPAAYPEAAELKKISVLDFQGTDGASFADQLTSELQSATLDGEMIFMVVSQDVIKAGSSIRSTSGSRNLAAAMKYGRKLGVQGVYYGDVAPLNITKRTWQEEHKKCIEYKNAFKCKKKEKYKVNCYEQLATYTAQPKLVNIRTGTVIYTESISSEHKNNYCTDSGKSYTNAEFSALLRPDVAKKVRRKVAPYNAAFDVQLKGDTEGLSPAATAKFKGAMAFGSAGQMDRACAIWQELSVTSPESNKSISLIYNLGVCAEIVADYDRAIELYSRADSMLSTPDQVVSSARERALRLKTSQKSI